jgi:hypothetical protein
MAASVPKRVFSLVTSLTARVGPYMYLLYAAHISTPLPSRLRELNQSVISPCIRWSGPQATLST